MVKNALGDTLNGDTLNGSTLKVVPDDAEHDYEDEDSYFAPGTMVKRRAESKDSNHSNEHSMASMTAGNEDSITSVGSAHEHFATDSYGANAGTMVIRKSRVSLDSVISIKIGALPDDEHSAENEYDHDPVAPPTATTPAEEAEQGDAVYVYDSNTMKTTKVNHTKDFSADYGDFGAHHAQHQSCNTVSEDHSQFDGGTMMTVKIKEVHSEDEEEEEEEEEDQSRDPEEDELNEYHENAFSPSSRITAQSHATIHSGNTVTNHIIMTTHVTPGGPGNVMNGHGVVRGHVGGHVSGHGVSGHDINAHIKEESNGNMNVDDSAPPGRRVHHNVGHRKRTGSRSRSHRGGGYSIGGSRSFLNDGTMVRHHSLDEDEEDCFQGQTMMYAPAMGSPRRVHSEDEEDDFSEETSMDTARTERTGHTAHTGPLSRVPTTTMTKCASTSSKQPHTPDRAVAMSDTITQENVYEITRGYANKPSSPMSHIMS